MVRAVNYDTVTHILAMNNQGEQRGNAACAYHCTQNSGNCICIITGGTVSLFFFNLHLQPLTLARVTVPKAPNANAHVGVVCLRTSIK